MVQSRRWCYTLNNYDDNDQTCLSAVPSTYSVYGREIGAQLTPHLQGFIVFKTPKTLAGVKKIHSRCHWEVARGTSLQASDYCKKDEDFVESGVFPASQGRRNDLTSAVATLKSNGLKAVAEQHPEVFVKYSRGLRDLALFQSPTYDHTTTRGWWIYGPPGTGKSHSVRQLGDLYIKAQNKWFDGYDGQMNILLDDLDTGVLGHYLKIWSDRWSCSGETKGGTICLRHHRFIVTSNYEPEHFWPDDVMLCEAINRRFNVIYKDDKSMVITF